MNAGNILQASALALVLSSCAHLPPARYAPPAGPTVWNFSFKEAPFSPSSGNASLSYRDPAGTGWGPRETVFGTASALGLPPVNGRDAHVMAFPAARPDQGYTLTHNAPPNGVYVREGAVSNYTLVMDVLFPPGGPESYRALYQTSPGNSNDAEMFSANRKGGGLGVGGIYGGAAGDGAWHRLAWTVQCALGSGGTGQITKFVDGAFAGGQYTPGDGPECRWALGPSFHLFTDDDGETGRGYITSLLFSDRLMTMGEIEALGSPSGLGADVPGPPLPRRPPAARRRVKIIGHRACTGETPENTLAGITRAFDEGADIVEVDVRVSAGGEAVLMHDENVRRTTDGSGRVSSMSLSRLRKLDAGSWFDARYAGEKVPTLEEALLAAKGRGVLFLDIKSPDMGRAVRRALDRAGAGPEDVWLSQADSLTEAADYRRHVPGAPIIWEGVPPEDISPEGLEALKEKGYAGFDLEEELITRSAVEAIHAAGMFVSAYTALDEETMLRLIELGVDAMETDYPAVLDALMPPRPSAPGAPAEHDQGAAAVR